MHPDRVARRAAFAFVALAAGLFLMPSLLSPLFAAKIDPAYPRLSENTAGSSRLEVRKLLHGQVDGLFVVPATGQVLAAAGRRLWTFSADGLPLGMRETPQHMHVSGIAFGPADYVDWVFTGDAAAKPYAPAVDGNGLSMAEVVARLEQAQVVAFGRDDAHAWAWLWNGERAWKLQIDSHREAVDTWCRKRSHSDEALGWESTCLQGYAPAAQGLVEIEPESFSRSHGDAPPRLRVTGFDRRTYHFERGVVEYVLDATLGQVLRAMGSPGAGAARYWFGDAHVQLDVGGDTVQFKAFVPQVEGDHRFFHTMRWWEPSRALPGASPWFSVHTRGYLGHPDERELLTYYTADVGLYVVRPRGVGDVAPAPHPVPGWQPRFEGEVTRHAPVTARVVLADRRQVERWLRPPPPPPAIDGVPWIVVAPVQADLHASPLSMDVTWGDPDDAEEHTDLRVELDDARIQQALAAGGPATRELVLRVPDLYGPVSRMQVLLREGGRDQVLPGARFVALHKPAFRPHRQGTPSRHEQLKASKAEAAAGDDAALDRFLHQAATLAGEPAAAESFAAVLSAAYAELVNASNISGRFDASARLVRHYLDQVHPHTAAHGGESMRYNTSVIASQALAFAIHQPAQRALVDDVMDTLIGPGFDPAAQPNATLAYNLACHYAVEGDVERMLEAAAAARQLGKTTEQFMADADFARYRDEPRFRSVVGWPR